MKRFRIPVVVLMLVSALSTPLFAYVTLRTLSSTNTIVQVKWLNGSPVSWQMNPTPGGNISGSREQADVARQSFKTWSLIPTADVRLSEGAPTSAQFAYDGKNVVVTNLSSNDWTSFGLGSSVLAFTATASFDMGGIVDKLGRPVTFAGQLMEADIVFNPSYEFSTEDVVPTDKIDFQSVLTHEIGHFLGLDHSPIASSTMFWTTTRGSKTQRTLGPDDVAGLSSIYPTAAFSAKGILKGTVRDTANAPVYGAVVIALNGSGQPVASAITDPNGQYTIMGLDSGSYSVYAQALEGFSSSGNFNTLKAIFPGQTIKTGFSARFR